METREHGTGVPVPNQRHHTDWQAKGRCVVDAAGNPQRLDLKPKIAELFFGDDRDQKRAIRRFCNDCPVIQQCLAYGEATRSDGVYGGQTEEQRHAGRYRWAQAGVAA